MESRVPTWTTFCPGTRLRTPKKGDDRVGVWQSEKNSV